MRLMSVPTPPLTRGLRCGVGVLAGCPTIHQQDYGRRRSREQGRVRASALTSPGQWRSPSLIVSMCESRARGPVQQYAQHTCKGYNISSTFFNHDRHIVTGTWLLRELYV
jgi:hypothetical protein